MEKDEFAVKLFEAGIPVFEEFEGIPNAPLFLMKFNLTRLTHEIILGIGEAYDKTVYYSDLRFNIFTGVSALGEFFAEAFCYYEGLANKKPRVFLRKENTGLDVITIAGPHEKGNIVLGIGGIVSFGSIDLKAIEEILWNGLYITNYLCLLDWGLGEKEALKQRYGIELVPIFTIDKLLSIWRNNGLLTKREGEAVIKRRDEIKEYIEESIKKKQSIVLSA